MMMCRSYDSSVRRHRAAGAAHFKHLKEDVLFVTSTLILSFLCARQQITTPAVYDIAIYHRDEAVINLKVCNLPPH